MTLMSTGATYSAYIREDVVDFVVTLCLVTTNHAEYLPECSRLWIKIKFGGSKGAHRLSIDIVRMLVWPVSIPPNSPIIMHAQLGQCVVNGEKSVICCQTPLSGGDLSVTKAKESGIGIATCPIRSHLLGRCQEGPKHIRWCTGASRIWFNVKLYRANN